jgi:large subunit ribosomal protein L25
MERVSLNAETRELGKGPSRRLRVAGRIPAVLYGRSSEPRSISVDWKEVDTITKRTGGSSVLVDLSLGGETTTALIRDYQADPFKRKITHIDFQVVGLDEQIVIEVPINLVGTPLGVKEGGVLEQIRRSMNIRCLVSNIPTSIKVDVAELNIGDNIHVNDLSLGEGIESPHTSNFTIATLVPPTKEEVPAVAVPVEGEVPEGEVAEEAPAEGEEKPAEGEAEEKKEE